ncbi:MAG: hypothetical protein EA389_06620 [Ilumatobacter sp.]|nr:MAG: hypothetical protein EA389_06620 [Ilumatobacter sp.]
MPDDAWCAVAELAASQHGAITRRQAAAVGFDARRITTAVRRDRLREVVAGVLVLRGHPETWHQRLSVLTLVGSRRAVASHRAAAHLHRLDGFDVTPVPEVSIERDRRLRLPHGDATLVHHIASVPSSDVVTVDGIPTTGLARTLVDLGSVVDDRAVRRALTDVRRRRCSLLWVRSTAERLHRPGQRGSGRLRRALDAIPYEGRVPDSWFEELLAMCLEDPALPSVVPQYRILDTSGRTVARVDLAIPEARVGLEAHSRRFHFGPDAEPLDEQRDLAAAACGWELLYLGWYASKRPAEVLTVVKDVVTARLSLGRATDV